MMNKYFKTIPLLLIGLSACNRHKLEMNSHSGEASSSTAREVNNTNTQEEVLYGDPTNDWLFKKIFENGNILKGFLNEMLVPHGIPIISEVQYDPTHLLANTQVGKECIIDVLCTDAKSENQFILEMQVANTGNFTKRAQCYASKAYIKHILKGKKERKKK